jgi:hypothetical protein
MYTFHIKETGPNLDVILLRALLVLSALACLVVSSNPNYWINILSGIVLLLSALFIDLLLEKWTIKKIVLLTAACIILLMATNSFIFALILFFFGILSGYLNAPHRILFSKETVQLKKGISNNLFQWNEFSNIILKDELITLDFKNNRLIQLMVNQDLTPINEIEFNLFCSGLLKSNDSANSRSSNPQDWK